MKRKAWYCRRPIEGEEKTRLCDLTFEPLFEGSKTAVVKWLKANNLWREYKRHKIRIGSY